MSEVTSALALAIQTNINNLTATQPDYNGQQLPFSTILTDQTALLNFCNALAAAIVTQLKTQGVLSITVATHTHEILEGVTGPPVPGPTAIETGNPTLGTGGIGGIT